MLTGCTRPPGYVTFSFCIIRFGLNRSGRPRTARTPRVRHIPNTIRSGRPRTNGIRVGLSGLPSNKSRNLFTPVRTQTVPGGRIPTDRPIAPFTEAIAVGTETMTCSVLADGRNNAFFRLNCDRSLLFRDNDNLMFDNFRSLVGCVRDPLC